MNPQWFSSSPIWGREQEQHSNQGCVKRLTALVRLMTFKHNLRSTSHARLVKVTGFDPIDEGFDDWYEDSNEIC